MKTLAQMSITDVMELRQSIRRQMRHHRQTYPAELQKNAAEKLVSQLIKLIESKQAKHISLYLSNDGELDTAPFIKWCWQNNIQVYLPVLHPFCKGHLLFLHYTPTTKMVKNKYGILEPKLDIRLLQTANNLDLIFTPLVAFDEHGRRLGMGGGYYDRTLAKLDQSKTAAIGLAYDYQKIAEVPVQSWDVDLSAIITPNKHYNLIKSKR